MVNHSRRSRAEWDEFARPTSSRRHRVLGRVGLSAVTAGVVGFGLSVALVPLVVALLVGAAAASAVGVVLLRRVQREAMGWGGKGPAERWVNPPRRGGHR